MADRPVKFFSFSSCFQFLCLRTIKSQRASNGNKSFGSGFNDWCEDNLAVEYIGKTTIFSEMYKTNDGWK